MSFCSSFLVRASSQLRSSRLSSRSAFSDTSHLPRAPTLYGTRGGIRDARVLWECAPQAVAGLGPAGRGALLARFSIDGAARTARSTSRLARREARRG